jgi:thioredoxin 1
MPQDVTAADFDSVVLASDKPVLVDFWAEWCGPCRMIAPVLEELDAEYGDKVMVAKVNVDNEPDLAMRFNITGIPLVGLFQGGNLVKQLVGARPKASYVEELAEYLG